MANARMHGKAFEYWRAITRWRAACADSREYSRRLGNSPTLGTPALPAGRPWRFILPVRISPDQPRMYTTGQGVRLIIFGHTIRHLFQTESH